MLRISVQTLNVMDDKDNMESLPEIQLEWSGNINDNGWKPAKPAKPAKEPVEDTSNLTDDKKPVEDTSVSTVEKSDHIKSSWFSRNR